MFAKSFPRKQILTKHFHETFLVENCLWLQNDFLENRFEPKIIKEILVENFFRCTMISSKTDLNQIFPSKFFWMQNDFLENRFEPINFVQNFFGRKLFMVAKWFPRKQVWTKNYQKNLGRKFFKVHNDFLENWFESKIFLKHLLSNILLGAKRFPRKQVWTKIFHQIFFGREFFMVAKWFPRKQF